MAPQHPGSEGVEGAGPHPLRRRAQQAGDPVSKFARCLVRERNGQDAIGGDASFMNEVGDPGGEDPRFSRSCPRQDQQWTLEVVYGFSLFPVQLLQVHIG